MANLRARQISAAEALTRERANPTRARAERPAGSLAPQGQCPFSTLTRARALARPLSLSLSRSFGRRRERAREPAMSCTRLITSRGRPGIKVIDRACPRRRRSPCPRDPAPAESSLEKLPGEPGDLVARVRFGRVVSWSRGNRIGGCRISLKITGWKKIEGGGARVIALVEVAGYVGKRADDCRSAVS